MPSFYDQPGLLDDIIDHSVGPLPDLFGIDTPVVKRWEGRPVNDS